MEWVAPGVRWVELQGELRVCGQRGLGESLRVCKFLQKLRVNNKKRV